MLPPQSTVAHLIQAIHTAVILTAADTTAPRIARPILPTATRVRLITIEDDDEKVIVTHTSRTWGMWKKH